MSSVTTTLHRLPFSNATNSMPVEQFARTGEVSTIHTTATRREQILAKWATCAGCMAGQATGTHPVHSFTARRVRQCDGSQVSLSCPTAILTYTKYMGGVDLGDQLCKYYCVRLKCNKNYKYIFWCMFDCCITNAFILSKFCTSPSSSGGISVERLKQFRVALAWSLIGGYNTRQRAGRPRSSISRQPTSSTPSHFPTHHMRKRCVYCHTLRSPPRRRESV